jgi:hypothetical protein
MNRPTLDAAIAANRKELGLVQFLGDRCEYTVTFGSETRVLVSPATQRLKAGEKVFLELKSEGISLWPREG